VAYTTKNFPTKKSLKEAVARGETIEVYQPGMFGPTVAAGRVCIEGPHFPKPHSWYAQVEVDSRGVVINAKGVK
jgi:hypothetical protein